MTTLNKLATPAIGLGLFFLIAAGLQAEIIADSLKTATAVRTTETIRIDGYLNEKAWSAAPPVTGFRQLEPHEGQPASESTMVKILYDDNAVYLGIWCYDNEPEKIIRQLTRRDRYTESDMVAVRIDSYHDHQTAYYFSVNAAGVLRDVLIYNNYCDDDSWDAVWQAEAKIQSWGWSVEYAIPYSALRFSRSPQFTWGLDFSRYIPRKNEVDRWQFVPSSETRGVSRYGHLVGIENIDPPGRMETMPYLVSYGRTEPKTLGNTDGREFISDIGLDLKYGLSSALTLDAAINPDFGQVESDRSIINLSTYETFYEEKRPFFLEGAEIFRTPFILQFYSRRIGRAPWRGVDEADYYIGYPNSTAILSAVKLTGKTRSGTALGVLNVTTREEKTKYKIAGDTKIHEAIVEPLANYSAVRIKQDVLGSSYIGAAATLANQREVSDAATVSADWKLFFNKERFSLDGLVIGTHNGLGINDVAAAMSLEKCGGKLIKGNLFAKYIGRETSWNRLGYMERNAIKGYSGWIQFYSNKRTALLQHINLNLNAWYNENLDGYRLVTGGNVNSFVNFANNWCLWWGVGRDLSKYDDRETRGNGLWLINGNYRYNIGGCTNGNKRVVLELNYHHDNERHGLFYLYGIWTNVKMHSNFDFSLGVQYSINRGVDFWVGTGEDDYPVFGEIDNDDFEITLQGIYTFQKNLSLQWNTQFYFSAAEYEDFRRLTSPACLERVNSEEYEISFQRGDYNYKALNLNLILRWEYLPGSTLFLVWTHARDGFKDEYNNFHFSRDFEDLFATPQTNVFLVKANYWWNI